jgi:hypothetical protein
MDQGSGSRRTGSAEMNGGGGDAGSWRSEPSPREKVLAELDELLGGDGEVALRKSRSDVNLPLPSLKQPSVRVDGSAAYGEICWSRGEGEQRAAKDGGRGAPHSPLRPKRAGRPSLDHCASMLGRPKINVVAEVRILIIPADATGVDIRVRPCSYIHSSEGAYPLEWIFE